MLGACSSRPSDLTGDREVVAAITFLPRKRNLSRCSWLPGHVLQNVESHSQRQRERSNHGPGIERERGAPVGGSGGGLVR